MNAKLAKAIAAVSEIFVFSFLGVIAGRYGDKHILKTEFPWLTLILALAGLSGAFYRLYKGYIKDEQ